MFFLLLLFKTLSFSHKSGGVNFSHKSDDEEVKILLGLDFACREKN